MDKIKKESQEMYSLWWPWRNIFPFAIFKDPQIET